MFGLFKSKEKKEFEKQLLLAQQGDAEAQYLVSSYYYNAKGTEQDLFEADKWLKESAKNGY
jgi:TPR repeat protein